MSDDRSLARVEERRARIVKSPQWRDGKFVNPSGKGPGMGLNDGVATTKEWFASIGKRRPPGALPMISPLSSWSDRSRTGLRATWLGHSTVLLDIDGARVLTDPVWAERASPSQIVGPRRFHRPPVALRELPSLDVVVVSHDHYDHLDAVAVASLATTTTARFVTSLGVGAHLERFGVPGERIVELDWWEGVEIGDLVITAAPAQHFSGRGPLSANKALWSSWSIASAKHRVFFSGDTGLEPALPAIAARLGPFDLVMLEVGAFHPAWGAIHLGPHQAMEALRQLGTTTFLPVHWSTFDLGLHPWDEPILALEEGARDGRLPLIAPRIGEARDVLHGEDVVKALVKLDAWWREVKA